MAFDHVGFFTIVGKYVKAINVWNGYISAITTAKNEIRDVYEAEDLHDLYVRVPSLAASFQNTITGTIRGFINDLSVGLIIDRDYVVEQLPTIDRSVVGILNGLYDYMVDNSLEIKASIVTLGGTDVNEAKSAPGGPTDDGAGPRLYCSRILDGVSAPGNGVSAHERYLGVESQLARTTTVFAEIISNAIAGNEVVQIYSTAPETAPYQVQQEEPSGQFTLANADAGNLIVSNYNFTAWTGDNPTGWSMTGGVAGTDWQDASGTGVGPLEIITAGVKALQALPASLQRNRMYFVATTFSLAGGATDTATVGVTIRNQADTLDYMAQRTFVAQVDTDVRGQAFGFFYLDNDVDLADVYVELHLVAKDVGTSFIRIEKVVCVPALYYNGLAWAWWAPLQSYMPSGVFTNLVPLTAQNSLAVANGNGGVFQTFFRRAFNIQLPTADTASAGIEDTLAT